MTFQLSRPDIDTRKSMQENVKYFGNILKFTG